MNFKTISIKILDTLQQGKNRLSSEAQKRIVSFVKSQLTENGSFMDKNGKADLYYTLFGLMLAYILRLKINTRLTEQWLDKQSSKQSDLVYYAAFIRSRMLCELLKTGKLIFALRQLFKSNQILPDFTDYPHGDKFSPYSQFLLVSLKEDLGIDTMAHQEILTSLSIFRHKNGGFCNFKGSKQATTNATVAALAVQGQLDGYWNNKDVEYLYSLQEENGGFYANSSALIPDLLSTATALFILKCIGITPRINADDFIDAHWLSSGGFCATLLDESSDVEYTFYGLLALGAL